MATALRSAATARFVSAKEFDLEKENLRLYRACESKQPIALSTG